MRTTKAKAREASAKGTGGGGPKGPEELASSTDVEDSYALERSRWELAEVSDPLFYTPALLASMQLPRAVSVNSSRSDKGWKVQPLGERVRENTRQGVVAYRQAEWPFMARRRASADAQRK